MTQPILIDQHQLSGGYERMHAIATVLDVKEINNANRNIVVSFKIVKILSNYTIPGLESLFQAYFPGIAGISRAPFNYDRLVESLGASLVMEQNGMFDLCQLINKTYVITIQEQDSANGDYYFQNLINLIEYPFATNSSIPSESTSTNFRETGFPSSAHNFSRANLNSLHQTAQNSEHEEFDPTDPRNGGFEY